MSPQACVIPSVHGWRGGGDWLPSMHHMGSASGGGDLHQGEGGGSAYRGGGVMHSGGVLPTQEGVCIQRGSASRGGFYLQAEGGMPTGGLHPGGGGLPTRGSTSMNKGDLHPGDLPTAGGGVCPTPQN